MKRARTKELMWGLGLPGTDAEAIETHSGKGYVLKNWGEALPTVRDLEQENPFLVWIHWRTWQEMSPRRRTAYRHLDTVQRVLLVDGGHSKQDLEQVLDSGFMAVLQTPLTRKSVRDAVERAAEVRHLYDDIYHMAQEILLEREMLMRKNEQLEFLNRFLARATETLDPGEILVRAREDLDLLLPVRLLQGIFWIPGKDAFLDAEIFLAGDNDYDAQEEWIELLLDNAAVLAGQAVDGYRISRLNDPEAAAADAPLRPAPQQVVVLPLKAGNETFGCLALLSDQDYNLGKDQVRILHSTVNHLGLALNNALLYRKVKAQAEYDGLTRIFNRRHFDIRLREEVRRHARYDQELSLVMIDLDHFKTVNDSHGHQAGDAVLKEVGRIIQETVRSSDIAARYGGEEFALLLPSTPAHQAWMLAERLRRRIAQAKVRLSGRTLAITASCGVATLDSEAAEPETDLLGQADAALYKAKSHGRNAVCMAQACSPEAASM